jgi:hypothetical protein
MFKYQLLLFTTMLGLTCSTMAQVYQSTDADGNVIYSDTPTADSEEVQVQKSNISDPVEVPAFVPEPEPAPEPVNPLRRQPGEELVGEVWVKDDDDGRKHLRELKIRPPTGPANPEK